MKRNEALDCRVYAYAALNGLLSMGLNLNKRAGALQESKAQDEKQTPAQAQVIGSRYV